MIRRHLDQKIKDGNFNARLDDALSPGAVVKKGDEGKVRNTERSIGDCLLVLEGSMIKG